MTPDKQDSKWVYDQLKKLLGNDHFYAMPGKVQALIGELEETKKELTKCKHKQKKSR